MLGLSLPTCRRYNPAEVESSFTSRIDCAAFAARSAARPSGRQVFGAISRSLSLRPADSLTVPKTALSKSFRSLVSLWLSSKLRGFWRFTPVGLPPTEQISLYWTHERGPPGSIPRSKECPGGPGSCRASPASQSTFSSMRGGATSFTSARAQRKWATGALRAVRATAQARRAMSVAAAAFESPIERRDAISSPRGAAAASRARLSSASASRPGGGGGASTSPRRACRPRRRAPGR